MSVIYGLVSTEFPEEIRYIGLTSRPPKVRLSGHKANARSEIGTPYPSSKWIKSVLDAGHDIELVVLCDGLSFEEAHHREIELIAEYRSQGAELLNGTDGGVLPKRPDGFVQNPE